MKLVVIVWEAVAGTSHAYLPREAANFSSIEVCNHAPLILPKMQDLTSLTLIWCSFSRLGREHVTPALAYNGGQSLNYDYLQTMPALITQDVRPKQVDTPLMLISRMGQGAFVNMYWSHRRPVHPKRTLTYHRYYMMINSRISECDHK